MNDQLNNNTKYKNIKETVYRKNWQKLKKMLEYKQLIGVSIYGNNFFW